MKNYFLFVGLVLYSTIVFSQKMWTYEELSSLPEKTSNNAVVEGEVAGEKYVYSFGGIGEAKTGASIHNRSYRYTVSTDSWEAIPDIPGTPRKIAMGASYVKDKIYIMGGYSVSNKGAEKSFDSVHVFDPVLNDFISQGTPIPIPVDDHVQAVWRDSLIFLVTGWSNTKNVSDVMIYDPTFDSWQIGTSVPEDDIFMAFGASGTIIGDTIYYAGGASMGANFPVQSYLRKGVIDPLDPTNIVWTQGSGNPYGNLYRSASVSYKDTLFWIGGSQISYNYNGIAYNGSGGVNPILGVQGLKNNNGNYIWEVDNCDFYPLMDLRGAAKVSEVSWVTCGGMVSGQEVTDKVIRWTLDPNVEACVTVHDQKEEQQESILIYPNLTENTATIISNRVVEKIEVFDYLGREIKVPFEKNVLDFTSVSKGTYFVAIYFKDGVVSSQKVMKK